MAQPATSETYMTTIKRRLQMQPGVSSSQIPWETFLGKERIIEGI